MGSGGFDCNQCQRRYERKPRGVAVGFVNGDSFLDAVFANAGGTQWRTSIGSVWVMATAPSARQATSCSDVSDRCEVKPEVLPWVL